jgi:long-chain acyl-CoA synthetase
MQKNLNLGNSISDIFKKNWHENFVFDAINGVAVTYEKFFESVKLYSRKLDKLGVNSGDTVVLIMGNSLDLMILYFASLLAGVRIVPIDSYKGTKEINEIFNQIECQAVITDVLAQGFTVKNVISIEEFKKLSPRRTIIKKSNLSVFNKINYSEVYLVVFTSGSTGASKGVMHSFENLIKSALSFGGRFNLGKENIFYHNLPMTYMAGILNQILMPFIFGSKIVIGDRFSIATVNNFWNYPIKYSANTFWFNPTMLSLLINLDRGSRGIEYTANTSIIGYVGTAPLNYSLKQKFEEKYKVVLYESYGLSETLFIATETPNDKRNKGSVGKKLAGVKINFAVDKEILLETEWMFLGYVGKDGNGGLVENKFLSGDLGYFDKDNFLHITGRKKDLIIRGGLNVSPRKIENFINDFNFFEESVILGMGDDVLGEKIVCFYVPDKKNYGEDSKKKINSEIIEKLGRDYKIDEFFGLVEIPKNTNGKVDKLKIKNIYKTR